MPDTQLPSAAIASAKLATGNQRKARVYHQAIRGKHAHRQCTQVIQYLAEIDQPQTVRMLHRIMNARGYTIDLVSLRRAVTNLSKANPRGEWENPYGRAMLNIAHEKPCPITKKTVGWYAIIPNERQMSLFK